jgi:hypothetical protein
MIRMAASRRSEDLAAAAAAAARAEALVSRVRATAVDCLEHLALVEALRGRLRRAARLAAPATAPLSTPLSRTRTLRRWSHWPGYTWNAIELRQARSCLKQAHAALNVPVPGLGGVDLRTPGRADGGQSGSGRSAEAYQAADCQVGAQDHGDAGHELKGMA